METRSAPRPIYEHEMSRQDHERLLRLIVRLPCMVMISGYWSDLYAEALAGWRTVNFQAQTRGGTTATEWLWMNYPEPKRLHDYRYLGDDFRERERIKKKKRRWVAKLRKMPRLERYAILSAIEEFEADEGTL